MPADTDQAARERAGYVRALRGANGAPWRRAGLADWRNRGPFGRRAHPGKGIVARCEAADVLHAYVELNRSAEWVADIDFTDAPAAAEFDGWAPTLTALITDGETAPIRRG